MQEAIYALRDSWVEDLRGLGVRNGDRILVRSDLRLLRPRGLPRGVRPDLADVMLDALLQAVGDEGTILMPTFTYVVTESPLLVHRIPPFTASAQVSTGQLPQLMLTRPGAVRSAHPTNSFVALGRDADILKFHDPYSSSFRPMEELVLGGGKQMLLGCVKSSPGFSTVHLAENHLGLSSDTRLSGKVRTRYVDPYGTVRVFRKTDIPGCSRTFGILYDEYRAAGVLAEAKVGGAPSMLVDARAAYDVEVGFLLSNRDALLCDRKDCKFCAMARSSSLSRRMTYRWERARAIGDAVQRRARRELEQRRA